MKNVRIIAGICWAIAGLILIIILFPGLNSFSSSVSKLPFMKLNPRYTGGEVATRLISEKCTLDIRKPVFNGFLKERNSGFVQLDWRGNLPGTINDSIDYDQDGVKDFNISVDMNNSTTILKPFSNVVGDLIISTATSYGWAVRVALVKPDNIKK
jgi:hypothetical protein